VLTTNDVEKYIQAIMFYYNTSRALAEKESKVFKGLSSTKKRVIIIRYIPSRQPTGQGTSIPVNNPQEGFHTFPHEIFHQVQAQYTQRDSLIWLAEGSAELFRVMASEAAGFQRVTDAIPLGEQVIRKAAKIPDTKQLVSHDYTTWVSLGEQGYPIYLMAALMTHRLVGDNGFEKVLLYYQLLDNGNDPDKAFITAFGKPMSGFLAEMNEYFNNLRQPKKDVGAVGIIMSKAQPQLVNDIMQGMPAAEAGIKIGDRILRVDGKDAKGLTAPQMVELLTGQAGSRVTIEVERQGETKPLSFTLIRKARD
jgi:hypothetical protein